MQKSIFITGAASGIGRATALRFAREGWFVAVYDVHTAGVEELARELGPGKAHAGHLDVADLDEFRARTAELERAAGRLDVLFNCAGLLTMAPFEELPPERARRIVEVNCLGVVHGVYAALPALKRTRGLVLNMSSASAVYGQPELAVYSASKFFVRGLTEALELELAGSGVRVSDIMPAYVATPMVTGQTHRAATLDTLGVKLTAERIAETAWRAAHTHRLHFIPQPEIELMRRVGGLFPGLARYATRKLSRL